MVRHIIEQLNESQLEHFAAHHFDVNALDKDGHSLLYQAVIKGRADLMNSLIEKGVNIHIKNDWGHDAIEAIIGGGVYWALEIMINAGVDLNIVYENKGSRSGSISCVIWSAAHFNQSDDGDRDYFKTVEMLINLGFDVNQANDSGDTPLLFSAFLDDPAIPLLLLTHGADPLIKNNEGNTACHVGTGVVADVILSLNEKGTLNDIVKDGDHDHSCPLNF